MAEPARKLDWDEGDQQPQRRFESLPGGGQGDGRRAGEGQLHAVPKGETPYDESLPNAEKHPGWSVIPGNPDAAHNAGAAKPELHALDKADNSFAKPTPKGLGDALNYTGAEPGGKTPIDLAKRARAIVSRHRKAISIASILIGGGGGLTIFGFLSLVPLKIDAVISSLDLRFQATTSAATTKTLDNMLSEYIGKYVLPGIKTGRCTSTISSGCVVPIHGDSPIARLYDAWRQNGLETKLAKDYHITFGKDIRGEFGPRNQLYMIKDGTSVLGQADLEKVMSGSANLFEVGGATEKTRASVAEARRALREATADETLWKRVYYRFKFGRFVEKKYGVTRCIIACNIRDKFTAAIADKKRAALAYVTDRVYNKFGPEAAQFFVCITGGTCDTKLQPATPPADPSIPLDDTKLAPIEADMQGRITEYALNDVLRSTATKLTDLVAEARKISEKGFTGYLIEKLLTTLMGDAGAELGEKAVPVIGWVLLAAQVVHAIDKAGPLIRYMSYMITAAEAVNLYMAYKTVDSEMKSGHMDATELGSFSDALGTNIDGAKSDVSDMTQTPLYADIMGKPAAASKSAYKCNDGSSVPTDKLLCPEEKLDHGNAFLDVLHNIVTFIPGIAGLADWIANNPITQLFNNLAGGLTDVVCKVLPGCQGAMDAVSGLIGQFSSWIFGVLVPSPFSDHMSGGRTFDMLAAGADVSANKSCQTELGCAKLTNQQVADIRNQQMQDAKDSFDHMSTFARLFSRDTPFSLVSRVAVSLPPTLPDAATSVSTMLSNPFATLGQTFSNIFSTSKAFAATPAAPDPFGVIQYGYLPSQIPADPQAYWDQNCQGDFTTPWLNNMGQDENTGEAVALTPQPCLLIQSMIQSSGAIYDPSFLPADATSSNAGSTGGGTPVSGVVFSSQNDPRWAGTMAWCGTQSSCGCVLNVEAMVVSTFTGKVVTPVELNSKYGSDNDPYNFYGLKSTRMWRHGNRGLMYNMPTSQANLQQVITAVKGGALVPVYGIYVGAQPFWGTDGHAELIYGIDPNNPSNFLVYDPWDMPDPSNPTQPDPKSPNDRHKHSLVSWPMTNFLAPGIGFDIVTKG